MKILLLVISLLSVSSAFSEDLTLLIDKETNEAILVENAVIENAMEDKEDLSELDGDFSLPENIVSEFRVGAFPMIISATAAIGVQVLDGHLEAGVEAGASLIMAGNGLFSPEVGVYAKYRINPDAEKTMYFRGRVFKSYNLNNSELNSEFSVGWERKTGFFELSLTEFTNSSGDSFTVPMLRMGGRIGASPKKDEGESIF